MAKIQFCVILSILVNLVFSAEEKLLYMTELVRHGARGPLFNLFKEIKWAKKRNIRLQAMLDAGWRQHYLAGMDLRLKYGTFFKDLKLEEYIAETTGRERCIESAIARMNGILDTMGDFYHENYDSFEENELDPMKIKDFVVRNNAMNIDPKMRFAAYDHCFKFSH